MLEHVEIGIYIQRVQYIVTMMTLTSTKLMKCNPRRTNILSEEHYWVQAVGGNKVHTFPLYREGVPFPKPVNNSVGMHFDIMFTFMHLADVFFQSNVQKRINNQATE